MAAAASLSLHLRLGPLPPPHHRRRHINPPRHAPFLLLLPSPHHHHLRVAHHGSRSAPPPRPPWRRPDVRARAGTIQAPGLARPGGAVETDRLPSEVRDRAMEAVDHFGGRVTIGDVASRAGMKVEQAERALQALAADTGGFLEVSEEGEVLYVFPKDYRAKLAGKSFRMKVEPLIDKTKEVGAYLVRVSFGTALIASIVLVYTTIIAIISSSSDEDNRGRRRRSYDSTIIIPTDLFWYLDADYYRRRRRVEKEDGMNFIESIFSFVFGDGDPNDGLEDKRWKMDDESFILPVLLRFQGHPEVDEQGNILYRFPSLQRTASSKGSGVREYVGNKWSAMFSGVEKYLEEKPWKFSKANASERAMVAGLGGLNLFGVIILGNLLKQMTVPPGGLISFVAQLFPLLQVYAGSFFAIPLFRWFLLRKTNNDIERRNKAREQRAQELALAEPSLRRKLLSARDMAQRKVITPEEIVYTTEKDLLDQDYEVKEWEKRFKELESD
uniref:Iron-sulfur cluster biosynthesis family protein n=1 Tax=Leersia perrieri TaxID=77586 RepID=A0A0D9VGM9_9ORYZ